MTPSTVRDPQRKDPGLRADLTDDAGDEGAVPRCGIEHAVERIAERGVALGVGRGVHDADDAQVGGIRADRIVGSHDAVRGKPRMLAEPGVEHGDDGASPPRIRRTVRQRGACERHGLAAAEAGRRVAVDAPVGADIP